MEKKSSILLNAAILVFANSGEEESGKKCFVHSEELFSDFNRRTLRTVEKTGLPYFHLDEKEQKGEDFGERFVHAIQFVFNKGFDYVITVGNDTPGLNRKHLLQALAELRNNRAVFGPSTDGGFYLMGISKSAFTPKEFLQLPWQTREILEATQELLSCKGRKSALLERLIDIDDLNDISLFINRNNNIPFSILLYIYTFLQPKEQFFDLERKLQVSEYSTKFYNKGSPGLSACIS